MILQSFLLDVDRKKVTTLIYCWLQGEWMWRSPVKGYFDQKTKVMKTFPRASIYVADAKQ